MTIVYYKKLQAFKVKLQKRWNRFLEILGVYDGAFAYKGPYHVQIDLTNQCNNNCIACWCNSPLFTKGRFSDTEKKQHLPYPLARRLIDELASQGVEELFFSGSGEPFLYPHIEEILAYAAQKKVACFVNTNFTQMSRQRLDFLIDHSIDALTVSVWAATPETYVKTHPNKTADDFKKIYDDLRYLNGHKQRVPYVKIYNVIFNMNYHEIEQMLDFAVKTGSDAVEFTLIDTIPNVTDTLCLDHRQHEEVLRALTRIRGRLEGNNRIRGTNVEVLNLDTFQQRLSTADHVCDALYDKNVIDSMPCYIGWLFARVIPSGEVHSCLKAHRIPTGNLHYHSFAQIWNSSAQRVFRKKTLIYAKEDPFFRCIGNDPAIQEAGCYKSCDDIARNRCMYQRVQRLRLWQKKGFALIAACLRARRSFILYLTPIWDSFSSRFVSRPQIAAAIPVNSRPASVGKTIVPPEMKEVIVDSQYRNAYPELLDPSRIDSSFQVRAVVAGKDLVEKNRGPVSVCLYGAQAEVHRWGSQFDEDDFFVQRAVLEQCIQQRREYRIKIGVRRTNFFKLDGIIASLHSLDIGFSIQAFSLYPYATIKRRFEVYLQQIQKEGRLKQIFFEVTDSGLFHLLEQIEADTRLPYYKENDLLRALGPVVKDSFVGPNYLLFNLCGVCNTDCVYCRKFSGLLPEQTRRAGVTGNQLMDLKLVERILQEAKALGTQQILLVGEGEPTLYPYFGKVLDLIHTYDFVYNFSTNGMLLHKYATQIVDGRCWAVTVSMSFASERSFAALRPGTDVRQMKVIERNVAELARLKRQSKRREPEIIILHAVCKENHREIPAMVAQAERLGADAVWFQLVHLGEFSRQLKLSESEMDETRQLLRQARDLCKQKHIKFHSFIDFELRHYDEKKGDWSKGGLLEQGCFVGWHFAYIDFRKLLYFCCGTKAVGLLDQEHALKFWWQSDLYRRYRNDGIILHRENPLDLFGKPLYEAFCDSCDNHDQNNMMIELLHAYNLYSFVER